MSGYNNQFNRAATFTPQSDEFTVPSITVAGAMVFVYVKDGELVVSVDLDEASDEITTDNDTVPMRINVQGNEVFRGR